MSRIGAILCGIYGVIFVLCIALAFEPGGDAKGHFVFMQLPIALQLALADELGSSRMLDGLGWLGAYLLLGLPTFALLYLVGWLLDGRRRS